MHRGLRLAAEKERAGKYEIETVRTPDSVGLLVSGELCSDSIVRTGNRVLLGTTLATTPKRQFLSPVSGEITAIDRSGETHRIVIRNDGRDERHPDFAPLGDYSQATPEVLRDKIFRAAVVGLGGAGFPTAQKLKVASANRTRVLIVNGVECEPHISCDDALMRSSAAEIVTGSRALMHASGCTEGVIAIENDKPEAIAAISRALGSANDAGLRLGIVRHFYPTGGERQLIQTVVGREVPSGGLPADVDVLCQNVGTAAAVARLIDVGIPLIDRIVTVTGGGVREPRNLRARFGTPVGDLIAQCGGYSAEASRLIVGGSMMGVAQDTDEITVGPDTNCIIVATPNDLSPREAEMPCIRCGDCSEVCPANLLPQLLLRYARADDAAALSELGLQDCIECGCCDYVCPSKIRLASTFVAAKHTLGLHRHS